MKKNNNLSSDFQIIFTKSALNYIVEHSAREIVLWKRSISGCFLAYDELVVSIKKDSMNFNFEEFMQIRSSEIIIYIQPEALDFFENRREIIIDFKADEFFPALYVIDIKPITHETTC